MQNWKNKTKSKPTLMKMQNGRKFEEKNQQAKSEHAKPKEIRTCLRNMKRNHRRKNNLINFKIFKNRMKSKVKTGIIKMHNRDNCTKESQ